MNFDEIPGNVEVPGSYTEIVDIPTPGQLNGMPMNICILGWTDKVAAQNVLFKNITAQQAEVTFGKGSVLAQAVAAFYKERFDMSVHALAAPVSPNSKSASGTLTFSGASTKDTTGAVILGGREISFAIAKGGQPSDVVTAILAAVTADDSFLVETGLILSSDDKSPGVLTVTASDVGEMTNQIDIRYSSALSDQIPGITCTVTEMADGSGRPDISTALAAIGDEWITDLLLLQNDQQALSAAATEARSRGNAMVAKDMRILTVISASQGQAIALAENFNTHKELVILPAENPRWMPWNANAAIGAQMAQALNQDPARQLNTIVINSLAGLAPETKDQWPAFPNRNLLLNNGCATFKVSSDGTVTLERMVTTCRQNPKTGAPMGVVDVMLPAIEAYVRWDWDVFQDSMFAQSKLADEGSLAEGTDGVVTCKDLKASWAGRCVLYGKAALIDDVDAMVAGTTFVRDPKNRQAVNGSLHITAMSSLIVRKARLLVQR